MWASTYPEFTVSSVDRMLAFLPEFERGDFAAAKKHYVQTGRDLPQVDRLCREVYNSGFVFAFDWLAWKKEEAKSALAPDAVAQADMLSLRKIMTATVRQERFFGGFLSSVCSSGLIQRVLERMRDLRLGIAGTEAAEPVVTPDCGGIM
jgi:hypothetical protein